MVFLSPEFIGFFLAVFLLYWTVGAGSSVRQNMILLLASVLFYGWLDLQFLALILFSAAANMAIGVAIGSAGAERVQRAWLWAGVGLNLGILAYFKYFNFFHDPIVDVLNFADGSHSRPGVELVLPLGISYYTFQLTGYLIDVFNGVVPACRQPLPFFTYVLYFPKLLAGTIERIQRFLPRIATARRFDPALISDAFRQVLWGAFAKLVIADNCARLADPIFNDAGSQGGSTLLAGAMLYLLQVYGDFSGYSNMAIGLSKMLGVPLMANFRAPLFATDVGDFWRRWHISLTTWMMDYVFIPLNFLFRGLGKLGLAMAIFITFLAVGIWHGANWTFVLFGVLQGIYFLPLAVKGSVLRPAGMKKGIGPDVKRFLAMGGIFLLMSLTFILMRVPSTGAAFAFWSGLLDRSLFEMPVLQGNPLALLLAFFIGVGWFGRSREHALAAPARPRPLLLRWGWLSFILFLVGMYSATVESPFIYFSF